MQNRDPDLLTNGIAIGFYEREFYVFSNFSSFQVRIDGFTYPTSEHAYHAAKFTPRYLKSRIRACTSAHAAFVEARAMQELGYVRPDWEEVKIDVMERICRAKLQQHEYVQRKLDQTGDLLLVEDSPYDSFWGWGPDRQGRNKLGKVWMRLREASRS